MYVSDAAAFETRLITDAQSNMELDTAQIERLSAAAKAHGENDFIDRAEPRARSGMIALETLAYYTF